MKDGDATCQAEGLEAEVRGHLERWWLWAWGSTLMGLECQARCSDVVLL